MRFLWLNIFLYFSFWAQAQIPVKIFNPMLKLTSIADSSQLTILLKSTIGELRGAGYITSGIDSSDFSNDTINVYLYRGPQFTYISSGIELVSKGKDNFFSGDAKNFEKHVRLLLSNFENNGYPFAAIEIDNVVAAQDSVVLNLRVDKKNYIVFDTFLFINESKLSKKYLARYLGIIPGKPYDESKVREIDRNLNNLPFVKLKKNTQIFFTRNLARLVFHFEDISNDQLDGVVGLAPNTENNPNADMILTGEVNLDFRNLFGAGRQLALNWRNYLQRSQKLMAAGAIPYVFGTKLGVNGSVLINKFDTFFVSSERSIGVDYRFRGNSFIGFYYKVNASSLISVDTAAIRTLRRLPQNNPYRIASYGFRMNYAQLDFFQNPRKGVVFRSDIAIGTRNILRDNRIDEVIFKTLERPDGFSLYDTLSIVRNLRGKIDFSAEFYLPLFKKATLYNHIFGGALIAPNILFNEYYNYGGFSTLKGFDELSLFARNYLVHNLEYRYLLNMNSFVGAFINYSVFQNDFNEQRNWDLPIGIGISGRIGVGKGQLNLAYALGRQNTGPFRISSGKIHFGYINYL